jgi:hypothetical protein
MQTEVRIPLGEELQLTKHYFRLGRFPDDKTQTDGGATRQGPNMDLALRSLGPDPTKTYCLLMSRHVTRGNVTYSPSSVTYFGDQNITYEVTCGRVTQKKFHRRRHLLGSKEVCESSRAIAVDDRRSKYWNAVDKDCIEDIRKDGIIAAASKSTDKSWESARSTSSTPGTVKTLDLGFGGPYVRWFSWCEDPGHTLATLPSPMPQDPTSAWRVVSASVFVTQRLFGQDTTISGAAT